MNPHIDRIHSRNTNQIKNHEALKMFFTTVKAAVLNLRYPFLPHAMQVAHYQQYVRKSSASYDPLCITLPATCLHGGHTPKDSQAGRQF